MSKYLSDRESIEDRVKSLRTRGVEIMRAQNFEEASACFMQCLTLKPDDHVSHRLLGSVYGRAGRAGDALRALQTATRLAPSDAASWYEMANLLSDINQCNAALQSYHHVLRLNPHYVQAAHNRADLLLSMGRVDEAVKEYRYLLRNLPYCRQSHENLLLTLNYLPEVDRETVFAQHAEYHSRIDRPHPVPLFISPPPPLRIGFVSADFRKHSVAYFIRPLLPASEETEVYCYASVSRPDSMTEKLKSEVSHWRDISQLSDREAAHLIARDGIHVLVDLSGHTAGNRLGVFTFRPAPVSATYLGYPNTTALPQMDYRITAETAEPPNAEKYYTEQPAYLPHGFLCYTPADNTPEPHDYNEPRPITYASFNNIAKFSEQSIEAWCRILKRSHGSRLLLKYGRLSDSDIAEELACRFTRRGIDRKRLELHGEVEGLNRHLAYYRNVDISLDTLGYNGTTTTCEALWMGVPVVTCAGDRHCQLVGASILRQLGISEWITANIDDYVETAVRLGEQPPRMRGSILRNHMLSSTLCNHDTFSRSFRVLLNRLWERNGTEGSL